MLRGRTATRRSWTSAAWKPGRAPSSIATAPCWAEHQGQWRYTIGQRHGLGLSSPEPLYVLERRPLTNEVVVGRRDELEVHHVPLARVVDRGLGDGSGLLVQLRYRSPALPVAALERQADDRLLVRLAEPFAGLAPGQSAVFYRDEVVVGGGVVTAQAGHEGEYDTLRTL